jgi:hypothetical protein
VKIVLIFCWCVMAEFSMLVLLSYSDIVWAAVGYVSLVLSFLDYMWESDRLYELGWWP